MSSPAGIGVSQKKTKVGNQRDVADITTLGSVTQGLSHNTMGIQYGDDAIKMPVQGLHCAQLYSTFVNTCDGLNGPRVAIES